MALADIERNSEALKKYDLTSKGRELARQIQLVCMAAEQFPAILTIKDYSEDGGGRLIYVSDPTLYEEGVLGKDYYLRHPGEIFSEADKIVRQDKEVLNSGKPCLVCDQEWSNKKWVVYKYPIVDGSSTYLVALVLPRNG